ncbi:hypothetical protein R7V41_03065 [Mesomycoplasma ovipneumoniae]|uniref:hypothetical protein n=1 Tax=Mesomycoplasma ovipneumoniae TaxID=29562 RepID=UPI0029650149|nr:hypothetical protein [Mesomycoplasma ovipneumoniae]MDW2914487.1 hypothetical protein [Mesomycoplasma ovipneumoniae]
MAFVKAALENFEAFYKENSDRHNSEKLLLEEAQKKQNALEIEQHSQKISLIDQQLSFQNFSSYFLNNFFTEDTIYKFLKNLASLDFQSKISNEDLVLFFKNLFGQSFLQNQLLGKLDQNSFFGKPKIQNSLLNILTTFFESQQVEQLLSELINYFFDKKEFEAHPNFDSLVKNFLKQNTSLIEQVFTLFLGDSSTWDSISEFLKVILQEYKLNLTPSSIQTTLDLVRDIFSKLRDSTLDFDQEPKTHSPLIIKALISIIFDAISGNSTPKKPVLETLFDSFSVDIANNYYSAEATSTQDQAKISQDSIATLISEVVRSEPISEQIRAGLANIPKEYLDSVMPIFDWFLKSPALKNLFNSYFKIVAKTQIKQPLNNLSLIKSLFEKQYFNKIIGEFIVALDEKSNTLSDNFSTLVGKMLNTQFSNTEFQPFFKLIKEIIKNNIENFYKEEVDPKGLFTDETSTVNVSEDFSQVLVNAQPFNDTDQTQAQDQTQDPNSPSQETPQETNTPQIPANYSKENALLTKFILVLSKFTSGDVSFSNVQTLLESEIANEGFIIDLIKQIATVYNRISATERDNLWDIIVKIFNSSFFKDKISLLSIGDVSTFSLFSGLSADKKEKIEPLLKKLLIKFLPNPINKVLIFRLLDYMNKNPTLFNEVKTFSGLLTTFLSDQPNKNANNTQSSSQNESNSAFLKSYLWSVLDFLVKDNEFADLAADITSVYLKLNLDNNQNLTKVKIDKPREIITKFLKDFVNLALENPLLSGILDQIVQSIKTLNPNQEATSFFGAIFSKLDLAKLINLDLVVKIEPKIGGNDATAQSSIEQKNLIDEQNLTLKTPTNQKISTKSIADFFDLIFLASPNWDKTRENEASPILKELNHIKYTGISLESIFKSNQKDPQLEAISKLFYRIWHSENNGSNKITIKNFKDSSKGRILYRLVLILLFYTYESRISQYWLRTTIFYGGPISSWNASEIIRASLQSGQQSNRNNTSNRDYNSFINEIIGNPSKPKPWWQFWPSWYSASDVKLNDMLTMIYYNQDNNRFSKDTGQPKLRDQILQQIHDGTYPDKFDNPNKR